MTPSARLQAAIDVLEQWFDGAPAEKALTNWARGARYAGSKDRAAVRDIVFECLRKRMYFQKTTALPDDARGLVIAHASHTADALDTLFVEGGYGPDPLSDTERDALTPRAAELAPEQILECPGWMVDEMARSLGGDASAVVEIMRQRAEPYLRVNLLKCDMATAQQALARQHIETRAHPLSETALQVLTNPRRIAASEPYRDGLVELQDVASQAVVGVTLASGHKPQKIIDYCAGGGGKSLALAAGAKSPVFATDINPARMRDIPDRAARAGARVKVLEIGQAAAHGPYDLVFCDAPCSGSGAWRRNPEGKWRLTPERAAHIRAAQQDVLCEASKIVASNGLLAYATCSIFQNENEDQIADFLRAHPGWKCTLQRRFSPLEGGDGFFVAHLTRD